MWVQVARDITLVGVCPGGANGMGWREEETKGDQKRPEEIQVVFWDKQQSGESKQQPPITAFVVCHAKLSRILQGQESSVK